MTNLTTETLLATNNKFSDWYSHGETLAKAERQNSWDIADWLVAGDEAFGQYHTYGEASLLFRMNSTTLRNYAWVARAFPPEQRNFEVTFAHHRAVLCVKDKAKRAELLRKADEERLSVAQLKNYLPVKPRTKEDAEKQAQRIAEKVGGLIAKHYSDIPSGDVLSEDTKRKVIYSFTKTGEWLLSIAKLLDTGVQE